MKNKILFRSKILSVILYIIALFVILYLSLALSILLESKHSYTNGDSAIVLGAAVWGDEPSPVFKSRIDYAILLYKQGSIKKIYFTGGVGDEGELSEGEMGKKYSISQGVKKEDIFFESESHTTYDNLKYIYPQLKKGETVLIVSDPMHVPRGIKMAKSLGINAYSAPTPFTRYVSMKKKIELLRSEMYFTVIYWLYGI